MRIFFVTALVLLVSLSVSSSVSAETTCTTTVNGQVVTGLRLMDGTCSAVSPTTDLRNSQSQTSVPGAGREQTSVPGTGSNITLLNPLKGDCSSSERCLQSFLESILAFVIKIGTVVVILMLVYVGYLFVAARGNSSKIEEARTALLWTIVGALILLGAQAIAIGIKATVDAISVGQ